MKRIIAASQNEHKIKEIEAITKEFGMEIISRHDAGIADIDIEEDGVTFEENSYKKAYEIMKLSGEITIADDSGIVVDCLAIRFLRASEAMGSRSSHTTSRVRSMS